MVLVNIIVWGSIFVWGSILNRKDLGLEYAWVWFKGRVKTACDSSERCKDIRAYVIKNPAISLSYLLFVIFTIVFGFFFPWFFSSFIKTLYIAVEQQIKNIDVNSYGFRSISLSIAGSITLLITILGVVLTLIRNLLTRQQNRTDEERLVTEQISRAVEQMGAYKQGVGEKSYEPNIEVRLGGLYSLQRIMKDSPKDEETIAKIFYAYVRENTKKDETKEKNTQPRVDVQTALDVIGQFNRMWKEQNKEIPQEIRLNFSNANFAGYFFTDINFSGADLFYADLENANLEGVDLSGAILFGANLTNADLSKVKNLTQEQIYDTFGSVDADTETKLPDDIAPSKDWKNSEEEGEEL
ncbi:MAG: pentapeptide repeat-containing protein [Candidatus Halichondribacter symbioticus]